MTSIYVPHFGPDNADIMLVGEAPGANEVAQLQPFVGPAGAELTNMLHQVGIIRAECFLTNVCKYQPPGNRIAKWFFTKTAASKLPESEKVFINNRWVDPRIADGIQELRDEIRKVKPKLIVALGNVPLWALTGEWGITKWRGSNLLFRGDGDTSIPILSTYHPAAILRQYSWRFIAVHDLRKCKGIVANGFPKTREDFLIRPSIDQVLSRLSTLLQTAQSLSDSYLDIAVDIETWQRHISCVGLAWSDTHALCIPFLERKPSGDPNYFATLEEELEVVWALRRLLCHPRVRILGQNFAYDQQYFAREFLFIPNYKWTNFHDTMTAHHVMWAGLPKGLDFLSSFYCQEDHVYWKDEGKEWDPRIHDEEQHWIYNCRDCVRTYKVAMEQRNVYEQLNFPSTSFGDPWTIQHRSHESVLRAMVRGVRIDTEVKDQLRTETSNTIQEIESHIEHLLGHPLNPRSPKQLSTLFYTDFAIKPVTTYDRSTGSRRRTCNADALDTIKKREVLLTPICEGINDARSLGTSRAVTSQELDFDHRIRCSYAVAGTETYRYSSREDAFGYGTNLQNITSGNESAEGHLYRPNLRKMFVPDPEYVMADHDLEQADARVVAWESDCPSLKEIFHDPDRDLHNENCEIIYGRCTGKADPNRRGAKAGVHAANYGATAPVLAAALGITVHEAERFLARYFGERPEVKTWHERVLLQLQRYRYVENVFGYRRFYFDRIEGLLKEALAWIPQSTVAIAVNLGIQQVEKRCPWAEFLLQVHDSAVHQWPRSISRFPEDAFEEVRKALEVQLPYEDPMTIPVSGEFSMVSWGDCK